MYVTGDAGESASLTAGRPAGLIDLKRAHPGLLKIHLVVGNLLELVSTYISVGLETLEYPYSLIMDDEQSL